MIDRCYLEITNRCNLDCVFCPKTTRPKHMMSDDEFEALTDKLRGKVKFLYFHLMGEPMLHPHLPAFIGRAREKGFIPVLTTNGTLMARGLQVLPHKIQISLHSQEGNDKGNGNGGIEAYRKYVDDVMTFATDAADKGCIVVLRLWNQGGWDSRNEELLDMISAYAPRPWTERYDGWRLRENLYVEYDQMFEWPDENRDDLNEDEVFCYALRNQIGVLTDGTVVPCCLDHDGSIRLGNLLDEELDDILASDRARSMYDGFSMHKTTEPLCRRCNYAAVTKRFRKSK